MLKKMVREPSRGTHTHIQRERERERDRERRVRDGQLKKQRDIENCGMSLLHRDKPDVLLTV